MLHTPTDMSKWWTRSSCKLCQKLVISPFQSKISDVPAGCPDIVSTFCDLARWEHKNLVHTSHLTPLAPTLTPLTPFTPPNHGLK